MAPTSPPAGCASSSTRSPSRPRPADRRPSAHKRARGTERNPPRLYLSALEWASFGISVPKGAAALGDVLVFKRKGGGHVGLYIGHDASAFHVLGGNQSDRVTISRLSKQRLITVRRPAYRAQPANVRPIALDASGSLAVLDYVSRLKPPAELVGAPDWVNPDFQ